MNKRKRQKLRWKEKQNKKNLIKRTIRKKYKKGLKILKLLSKRDLSKKKTYNKEKNELIFTAHKNFSIINNPKDNINYFNNIIRMISNKYTQKTNVFFDISPVEEISIDAIMYMLAVVKNTKIAHNSKGNLPKDKIAAELFIQSGFLKYVNNFKNIVTPNSENNIQIKMNQNPDNNRKICKEILQFLIKKLKIKKESLKFLYNMLSELMLNTNEHAYNSSNELLTYWYLFIELETNIVKISFLDTGDGIPYTINRKFHEKLGIVKDADLIISALEGNFKRTKTQKAYRGKGLPKISSYIIAGKINNFKIVSGNGLVCYNEEKQSYVSINIDKKLIGTLYYWEINLTSLLEEGSNDDRN